MRRARRQEDAVQRAVFNHLRARGAPDMVAFHVPNGGKRSRIEAAIMKGLGVTAGIPDIIIVKDRQTFALELKPEHGGRLEPSQKDMLAALDKAGAFTAVAHGVDQALRILEAWGVLRGHAELRTLGDVVARMNERLSHKA